MSNDNEQETKPATRDVDLGTAERFPRELAPFTAESVKQWTRVAITTPPSEIRGAGVPPAYQLGLVGGLLDVLEGFEHQLDETDEAHGHIAWLANLLREGMKG